MFTICSSILLTSLQLHTNNKIENLHFYLQQGGSKIFSCEIFSPCDILTDVNRLALVNHYARKLFRSIHQHLVSNKDEVRIPSHFARKVYILS